MYLKLTLLIYSLTCVWLVFAVDTGCTYESGFNFTSITHPLNTTFYIAGEDGFRAASAVVYQIYWNVSDVTMLDVQNISVTDGSTSITVCFYKH
jgi:hypothetical protein